MIVSTGNNFGAGEILMKDYQNENLVALNSKICFDPKNEDFHKASQLEIYVPDLSIPRSCISGCFILVPIEDRFYVTTLKTWVKDRNTVCVEKRSGSTEDARSCAAKAGSHFGLSALDSCRRFLNS